MVRAKIRPRVLLNTAYTYTSSEYLDNPAPYDAGLRSGAAVAAAAETFGDYAAVLFGDTVGRECGREFCGAAGGLGFRRVWD